MEYICGLFPTPRERMKGERSEGGYISEKRKERVREGDKIQRRELDYYS